MPNEEFLVMGSQNGRIQALNAHDGVVRWNQTFGHPFAGCALARVGNDLVAVSGDGYVGALSLEDGTMRWEISVPIAEPLQSPMYGLRLAANQQLIAVQLSSLLVAIDVVDGHTVWQARPAPNTLRWWLLAAGQEHIYTLQVEPQRATTNGLTERSPHERNVRQPLSFVTTAFSAWDGTPQWWARETSAVEPPWDGPSSLMEVDGVVYIYSHQGLHALETTTGTPLWTCATVPHHHVGALAIGRDCVIVAADRHLGAYRRDTGTLLWEQTAEKRTDGYFEWFDAPLILDDRVYVGRSISRPRGFQLECHEVATGALLWTWPALSTSVRPDIAWRYRGTGDALYVPSLNDLWSLQPTDGSERWRLSYDSNVNTDSTSAFNAFLAVDTSTE